MKKKIIYRLLAFAAIFTAGAVFIFAVGTYRNLAIKTYSSDPLFADGYDCELAVIGDRAADHCDIAADSELIIGDELDSTRAAQWLADTKPEKLIIFLECTSRNELNDRLDNISLLISQSTASCKAVYVMSAPPPLLEECTSDFRPMYVRQNNHALEDLAERYGAEYIDEHTVSLASMKGTVAEQYAGEDLYFSDAGVKLVNDVIDKYVR